MTKYNGFQPQGIINITSLKISKAVKVTTNIIIIMANIYGTSGPTMRVLFVLSYLIFTTNL